MATLSLHSRRSNLCIYRHCAGKQTGRRTTGREHPGRFLYNPDRVSLTEKPKGDATAPVGVDENGLSLNPGCIDPTNEAFTDSRKPLAAEFEFNGEQIIVIANHLNSKGGDDGLFGETYSPGRTGNSASLFFRHFDLPIPCSSGGSCDTLASKRDTFTCVTVT
mgnify:CR=1 FL=1|jgi:predicted extracellular nuclease